jgi:trehalose synthase
MLPKVSVRRFSGAPFTNIESYRQIVEPEIIEDIDRLARDLKGIRVCHINSTGFGGGVAELLARYVPMASALGIDTDWRLLQGTTEFFTITKALHNALQGASYALSETDKAVYLHVNRESAASLDTAYDVFVVHDPQPAAFRQMAGARAAKWIWRCHIDTSSPNLEVAQFLLPFLDDYDAVVFTLPEFVLPGLHAKQVAFIAPAIDPFSTKNMELPRALCREVIANAGIDPRRPLVVQVSRFDPWKDPLGVIEAYRLAKRQLEGLQLAMIGAIAGDDPEGWQLLARVQHEAAADNDLFVFTNLAGVGSMEVNAFQRGCDLVIQKSLREGFGLVVCESFWKGMAVVAGRAGGIPMQFPRGYDRYLISTVQECADRMVELLRDPSRRATFGRDAREHVRQHFLMPRLLRDELQLFKQVLGR